MKSIRTTRWMFAAFLLVAATMLGGPAHALPSYYINGYTNSLVVEDGDQGSGFGFFSMLLTGGTAETPTHISGLTASFTFTQDTDPAYGYDPAVEFLPGGGLTYSGTFAESYDLVFDGSNIHLEDPASTFTTLISLNGITFPPAFTFLTAQSLFFDFLGGFDYGEMVGTNTADGLIVSFTVDQAAYVATPEPSTFALIAIGLGGMGFLRFRQRRNAS